MSDENDLMRWSSVPADNFRFLEAIEVRPPDDPCYYFDDQHYLEPEKFATLVHLSVEADDLWYFIMHRYFKLAINPHSARRAQWSQFIDSGSFCAEYMNSMHRMYLEKALK
jgi:hypothetical protein